MVAHKTASNNKAAMRWAFVGSVGGVAHTGRWTRESTNSFKILRTRICATEHRATAAVVAVVAVAAVACLAATALLSVYKAFMSAVHLLTLSAL